MFFYKRPKTDPERVKKEQEGDILHEKVMEKIKKLNKETENLENEVSYRIFIAMGGNRRPKK